MSNRILSQDELVRAKMLLAKIREELNQLASGDADLLFAYRRKISKELQYDERSSPKFRRKLKAEKRKAQAGICPLCKHPLPEKYTVLDRLQAAGGYTPENTRLICEKCDRNVQAERGYG